MAYYLFYGIEKHTFVGYATSKSHRDAVLKCRPKDFEVLKIRKKDFPFDEKNSEDYLFIDYKFEGITFYLTREESTSFSMYGYDYLYHLEYGLSKMEENLMLLKGLTDYEYNIVSSTVKLLHLKVFPLLDKYDVDFESVYHHYGKLNVSFMLSEFLEMKRHDEDLDNFMSMMAY